MVGAVVADGLLGVVLFPVFRPPIQAVSHNRSVASVNTRLILFNPTTSGYLT
jgi:methylglyoxal synthase